MFKGCFTALVTPFTDQNEVDYAAFKKLIDYQIFSGVDGIVCLATTGEAPTLKQEEKERIIQFCVDHVEGKIKVIANTGTNCTDRSVALTKTAKKLAVDGCLVVVPYYNKPTEEGCIQHFSQIANVGLPLIVYHHPGRTGTLLKSSTFSKLEKIGEVVAIKEATGSLEKIVEIGQHCSIPILAGEDKITLDVMKNKAVGCISVISNLIPYHWKRLMDASLKGDFLSAEKIITHFQPLIDSLGLEVNPQCIKYALSLVNLCSSNLRLPLIKPKDTSKEKIKSALFQTSTLKELLTP